MSVPEEACAGRCMCWGMHVLEEEACAGGCMCWGMLWSLKFRTKGGSEGAGDDNDSVPCMHGPGEDSVG